MGASLTSKVGKRGTVVLPAELRRQFGMMEGAVVIAEAKKDGILLRPAVVKSFEVYTPRRRAEFLLANAVDARDYARACTLVRKMGLDPAKIPHPRPNEVR
jgi:AbrB family looped-hinge helix DNA binding protein